MSASAYTKKPGMNLLLDFVLVILIFLVVLLGIFVYSVNLSRRSGHDVTTLPREMDLGGKVGRD